MQETRFPIANTSATYRGLLSAPHYYGAQIQTINYSAPADDPLPLHLMCWGLEIELRTLFMGRIADVTAALTAPRSEVGLPGKIILQIADAQGEWNNQTFAVTTEAGQVIVAPTQDTPEVTLDI